MDSLIQQTQPQPIHNTDTNVTNNTEPIQNEELHDDFVEVPTPHGERYYDISYFLHLHIIYLIESTILSLFK